MCNKYINFLCFYCKHKFVKQKVKFYSLKSSLNIEKKIAHQIILQILKLSLSGTLNIRYTIFLC